MNSLSLWGHWDCWSFETRKKTYRPGRWRDERSSGPPHHPSWKDLNLIILFPLSSLLILIKTNLNFCGVKLHENLAVTISPKTSILHQMLGSSDHSLSKISADLRFNIYRLTSYVNAALSSDFIQSISPTLQIVCPLIAPGSTRSNSAEVPRD